MNRIPTDNHFAFGPERLLGVRRGAGRDGARASRESKGFLGVHRSAW